MSEEEDKNHQNKDEIDFWMNSDDDVVNVSSDEDEKPAKQTRMPTRKKSVPAEQPPININNQKTSDFDAAEVDQIIELDDESSEIDDDNDFIVTRNGKKISREQHSSHAAVDYQYAKAYPPKAIVEEDFVDPNKAELNNAIDSTNQMIAHIMDLAKDDEEPDDLAVNTISGSSSDAEITIDPADPTRKLVHISSIEGGNRWKVIWDQKDTFEQILYKISPELRNSIVTFSGIQWKINEVTFDIVSNGEEITLSEPVPEQPEPQDSNDIKLSFLLPDGTKKKLKVPLDKTWGYVLQSIGTGTKLLFDGEELNLRQKISSNHDIEDEDQIDVA